MIRTIGVFLVLCCLTTVLCWAGDVSVYVHNRPFAGDVLKSGDSILVCCESLVRHLNLRDAEKASLEKMAVTIGRGRYLDLKKVSQVVDGVYSYNPSTGIADLNSRYAPRRKVAQAPVFSQTPAPYVPSSPSGFSSGGNVEARFYMPVFTAPRFTAISRSVISFTNPGFALPSFSVPPSPPVASGFSMPRATNAVFSMPAAAPPGVSSLSFTLPTFRLP
ncbi:MAG: hypothetical protein HYU64_18410 [Armatimonadetes bacterium]|nr:hypothetical protein [Armatimonadota bacterium]